MAVLPLLPTREFPPVPEPIEQVITRPDELAEVCAWLAEVGRFGFDTEFVGEDTYQPKLCLIQVAAAERLILIDPFTVGPLDAFWELITDPRLEVVVHAAREEMRLCKLWTGRRPENVFDLQIAAGLAGYAYPLGHGTLVQQLLGVRLNKSETLTEWRGRPLTPQQVQYAFDDVRYLLQLGDRLRETLRKMDRLDWLREEVHRLGSNAVDEEAATTERWRKLRGIGTLTRRQLAIVREIHLWRETAAARFNRPPRVLCRDDLIIEVARRSPTSEKELKVIRGLNRMDWPGLLAAVQRGREVPASECPPTIDREIDPPQVGLLASVLQAVAAHLASELKIAPGLIASNHEVRTLVRRFLGLAAGDAATPLDRGWRLNHIRPRLERVLRGETTLRVAKPSTEAPFELADFPGSPHPLS